MSGDMKLQARDMKLQAKGMIVEYKTSLSFGHCC